MKFQQLCVAIALASCATASMAKPIWQDFSLTALYGENYELTPEDEQTTVTAEYAAKLKYGDFFGFIDRTESGGAKDSYFEASPRLSFAGVSGKDIQFGIVKDVLISTTWEGGEGFNNYLYGVGVDLDIPYFQYASANIYRANNEDAPDDWQLTLTYGVPFQLSNEDFLFDGFLDWSTEEENGHESELNWTSQLKWNAGKHISPDTRLYLGIEYSHWINKYSIEGMDEHNVSALVKYHF